MVVLPLFFFVSLLYEPLGVVRANVPPRTHLARPLFCKSLVFLARFTTSSQVGGSFLSY